jgi:predicted nucleic acid-binding protein
VSRPRKGVLVVDASAVVAALGPPGAKAEWAVRTMAGTRTVAPQLLPFEVAAALRNMQLNGVIDAGTASSAHHDLQSLPIELWPHRPLAGRAWDLRESLTYYDACYIALAERLEAALLTLDRRLARAPGPRCEFLTPPAE